MAAERYSTEVLRMFSGRIAEQENAEQENADLPQPLIPEAIELDDVFILARRDNFRKWLRVWKLVVLEENPFNNELLAFARENQEKFTNIIRNEIEDLRSVKAIFDLKAEFSIVRSDERKKKRHYLQKNEPHIFDTMKIL